MLLVTSWSELIYRTALNFCVEIVVYTTNYLEFSAVQVKDTSRLANIFNFARILNKCIVDVEL